MLRLLQFLLPFAQPRKQRRSARLPAAALPDAYVEWLADWSAIWSVPKLPAHVRIVFSQRLRRALGRCSPRTGSIRLNPGLLAAAPEALREVVCHEAAHAAVWLLHGRGARPHGREWKALMRRAGYEPRVRWAEAAVPESVRARDRAPARYVHTCPVCRASRVARRAIKAWRCRACHDAGREGLLAISKLPPGSKNAR